MNAPHYFETHPDPAGFDIALHENGFLLCHDGKPVLTLGGNPCYAEDRRILQDVMVDILFDRSLIRSASKAYLLFSLEKDLIAARSGECVRHLTGIAQRDPFFGIKKPRGATETHGEATIPGSDDSAMLTLAVEVLPGIFQAFVQMVQEGGMVAPDVRRDVPHELSELLVGRHSRLSPQLQAGVLFLLGRHDTGLVLPLMLVEGRINATSYGAAAHFMQRRGLLPAATDGDFLREMVREGSAASSRTATITDFCNDALSVLDYIQTAPRSGEPEPTLKDLIARGESFHQEFKSTLRWNIRAEKKDPAIEHASLKTIAAFLNSDGGTLVIGVDDDGGAVGVELDDFPNIDKFSLHFWNLVKSSFGQDMTPFITLDPHEIDGKTVCVVRCAKSTRPAFLRQKGFDEEFYIRVGPASASLNISEALQYIADRFQMKGSS